MANCPINKIKIEVSSKSQFVSQMLILVLLYALVDKQLLIKVDTDVLETAQELGFTHLWIKCKTKITSSSMASISKSKFWRVKYCKSILGIGIQYVEGGNEYFKCDFDDFNLFMSDCPIFKVIKDEIEIE